MIIDWNIRIEDGKADPGTYKIRQAVKDAYCIVFIECGSWEEAESIREEALKHLSPDK